MDTPRKIHLTWQNGLHLFFTQDRAMDIDSRELLLGRSQFWFHVGNCFFDLLCCSCYYVAIVVVQSPSHIWLYAAPWTAAHQASLSLTVFQSLPKFIFMALVIPSSHLILWCHLLLLPSIFLGILDFSNEVSVYIRWAKYQSFSISSSNNLATWCKELTHLKRLWSWERLKAGGEGDDRGWDGWMAPLTQWTWVWESWWWTGRPSMLQSMEYQRVRHDWVTELNWWY